MLTIAFLTPGKLHYLYDMAGLLTDPGKATFPSKKTVV